MWKKERGLGGGQMQRRRQNKTRTTAAQEIYGNKTDMTNQKIWDERKELWYNNADARERTGIFEEIIREY